VTAVCTYTVQSAGQVFGVAEPFRRWPAVDGRRSWKTRVPLSHSRERKSSRHSHVSRTKQQASAN